ncbi:hypothetical protein ACFOEE_08770 [Pseudoalteromonas fenneropenaei]|uniref:DUF3995 domain-containing protein n=1 Tax=Pseudoalteromonas fenneropenaei TaxID=1737459 RepID=A0ABV7CIZ9_9GAMM
MSNPLLVYAGVGSIIAALLHVAVIFGGPDWYRWFGAGEKMAQLAASGSLQPALITAAIATLLTVWGILAFSTAGLLPALPSQKPLLIVVTTIYCVRGAAGFLPVFFSIPATQENSPTFWFWSSAICLALGVLHLLGLWRAYQAS